jgi:HK97 family phage major capsid protein
MDTITDLETRRTQLIAELNNADTPAERLEAAFTEAAEVRRQIDEYNSRVRRADEARAALEGARPERGNGRRIPPAGRTTDGAGGADGEEENQGGTWGDRFIRSDVLNGYQGKGPSNSMEFADFIPPGPYEARALLSGGDAVYTGTGAGAFQRPPLQPWVATLNPDRVLRIIDIIDRNTTEQSSVDFVQDTTAAGFGGNAAETGEGVLKPETAATFAQKTAPVRTVPHYIPITRQALDDNRMLRGYIDGRLRFGLLRRIDSQIINGDGTGMNLTGILGASGIGTYAPGSAEARLISLRKGRTISELTELEPTALIINPSDWEKVDLLQSSGSGEFMAGPGGQLVTEGLQGGVPGGATLGNSYPATVGRLSGRLWGMVVIPSTAIAAGIALLGNFAEAATLWDRQQTQVLVTDSHADYFVRNILVLLAEARVALTVQQPKSFVKITFNGTT